MASGWLSSPESHLTRSARVLLTNPAQGSLPCSLEQSHVAFLIQPGHWIEIRGGGIVSHPHLSYFTFLAATSWKRWGQEMTLNGQLATAGALPRTHIFTYNQLHVFKLCRYIWSIVWPYFNKYWLSTMPFWTLCQEEVIYQRQWSSSVTYQSCRWEQATYSSGRSFPICNTSMTIGVPMLGGCREN